MTQGNINNFGENDKQDILFLNDAKKIIQETINKINLNLSNLTVLTEAATGNWIYTPFIAAFANAKKVICITKDSKYGSADNIIQNFEKLSKYFDFEDKIKVYKNLDKTLISQADIVTNLGFVRPIDKEFISSMKETSVISLMWEPWEFREKEIDLRECWKKGISILGVNENNEILNIMKYDGQTIVKILEMHEENLENKNIILVAENISALHMIQPLRSTGSKVFCVTKSLKNQFMEMKTEVIGSDLTCEQVEKSLSLCDIIIINSAPLANSIIGGEKGLSIDKLKEISPSVRVYVYFGAIDFAGIKNAGIKCFPSEDPGTGHMGWTVDLLGPRPTIELNSLGLKVGELLAEKRLNGTSASSTENELTSNPFCLDFSEEQKQRFCQ